MRSGKLVDLRRIAVPKSSPIKKRKKSTGNRRWVIFGVIIAVVAMLFLAGLHFFTHIESYQVRSFSVIGARAVPTERITGIADGYISEQNSYFISHSNMLLFSASSLEAKIESELPRILKAQVDRSGFFSTAATISIIERVPFAKWCRESWCYIVDEKGFIFGEYESTLSLSTPYTYRGGIEATVAPLGQSLDAATFVQLTKILSELGERQVLVRGIEFRDTNDVAFTLDSGTVILASFSTLNNEFLKSAEVILSSKEIQSRAKEIEYVDFRYGNRVYYSFKKDQSGSSFSTGTTTP